MWRPGFVFYCHEERVAWFKTVFNPCMKMSRKVTRFLRTAILLFLFFLPLHFLFTVTVQGSEECACCYH
jgi:hypothetical protein